MIDTKILDLLDPSRPVVVALSGGVDSIVLAELVTLWAKGNAQNVSAIHVNHGLSNNAEDWSKSVTAFCEQRSISLAVVNVTLDKQNRESLEDVARKARHKALIEQSPEGAQIVLGHHLDDQLETMLIALKRGAGALRMSGMDMVAEREGGRVFIRPLLETSKADIIEFATSRNLSWVEDESNDDSAFDRNFLRNEIIPLLKNRWPGILSSTARSSRILRDESKLIEDHAKALLNQASDGSGLKISELKLMTLEQRKIVIRYWIMGMGLISPREDRIIKIYNEVALARPERSPQFRVEGGTVMRKKGVLIFERNQ